MSRMTIAKLSARYRRVALCVDRVPRTATEIYRRYAELPEWKALTRRHRNERKWLAGVLVNLSNEGVITRGITDEQQPFFWRVDADASGRDQPGGAEGGAADRRPV